MLILTAFIWGVAFVAQSVGLQYIGPFTFNAVRSFLGGLVLIPCMFYLKKKQKEESKEIGKEIRKEIRKENTEDELANQNNPNLKMVILGGLYCGIILFISSAFQQYGIKYTTVGKAGFITALYIIIVPIMGIFLKKKVSFQVCISIILAIIGMYFLCISETFQIGKGDILVLLCAISFSVHILVIDYFSSKVDGILMSCIQFFICGMISLVPMMLFEHPDLSRIIEAWQPLCYVGILSGGVGYTFQIVGQKHTEPTIASLILSMESVISVLAGWVLLGQVMSTREIAGSALVFCAIIIAQLKKEKVELNLET